MKRMIGLLMMVGKIWREEGKLYKAQEGQSHSFSMRRLPTTFVIFPNCLVA